MSCMCQPLLLVRGGHQSGACLKGGELAVSWLGHPGPCGSGGFGFYFYHPFFHSELHQLAM